MRSLHVEVEVAELLSDFLHLWVVVVLKNLAINIIELMLAHAGASPEEIDLLASQESSNVSLYLDDECNLFHGEFIDLPREVALRHLNSSFSFLV